MSTKWPHEGDCAHAKVTLVYNHGFAWHDKITCNDCETLLYEYSGSTLDSDSYGGPKTFIGDKTWFNSTERRSCTHPKEKRVKDYCSSCGQIPQKQWFGK